jgi:hypothetical protein
VDVTSGVRRGFVAGLAVDELSHVARGERAESDPAVAGQPAGGGKHPREPGPGSGRAVPECADDGSAGGQPVRQVAEQLQRGRIGPLEIVHDEQHRPLRRGQAEDGDDVLEQAELGAAAGGRGGGVTVSRFEQAAELAGEPLLPQRRRQAVEDRGKHLLPRPHRRRPVAL